MTDEADTCTLPAAAGYPETERLLTQTDVEGIALRLTYGLARGSSSRRAVGARLGRGRRAGSGPRLRVHRTRRHLMAGHCRARHRTGWQGIRKRRVDQLVDLYAAFRAGWANTPYEDLERVLGRTPVRSVDAVREALAR
jgi:hypothetical protein